MRRSTLPARVCQIPVMVTITLRKTLDALLAIAGTRLGAYLQVHQPFGGETDHLAEQVGISALFHERAGPSSG